ncbi:MAG: hypothetical protein ABR501_06050 [Pyrinomonadaceae bacterium]
MLSLPKTSLVSLVTGIMLFGVLALSVACTHRQNFRIGSHEVTVLHRGFEKFHIVESATEPAFEYSGISTDGTGLKVSIKADTVTVNGVDRGKLQPGDSVLITDDGVAVNSLDYGETEKYLRANSPATEASGNTSASNGGVN